MWPHFESLYIDAWASGEPRPPVNSSGKQGHRTGKMNRHRVTINWRFVPKKASRKFRYNRNDIERSETYQKPRSLLKNGSTVPSENNTVGGIAVEVTISCASLVASARFSTSS
jgi:hypothetical protein